MAFSCAEAFFSEASYQKLEVWFEELAWGKHAQNESNMKNLYELLCVLIISWFLATLHTGLDQKLFTEPLVVFSQ